MSFFSRLFGKDEQPEGEDPKAMDENEAVPGSKGPAASAPVAPPVPTENKQAAAPVTQRRPEPPPVPRANAKPARPIAAKAGPAEVKGGTKSGPATMPMFAATDKGGTPLGGQAKGASSESLADLLAPPPPPPAKRKSVPPRSASAGRYSYSATSGGTRRRGPSAAPAAAPEPPRSSPKRADASGASPVKAEAPHVPLTLPEPIADSPPTKVSRRSSKRPPPAKSSGTMAAVDAAFDTMLTDLDSGFSSMVRPEGMPSDPGEGQLDDARDSQDVRQLFEQIAAHYVRPVRDLMLELGWGRAVREWVPICVPAVTLLRRSAEKMSMPEVCSALDTFQSVLERCAQSGGDTFTDAGKAELTAAYSELVKLLPGAFAVEAEQSRREPIIVLSLLLQVPGVQKVAIDKIYAAGLTTLDTLLLAKPDDIVQTTGLQLGLARAIVERFQAYKKERADAVPDAARTAEHERLAKLASELRAMNQEYEGAAKSWTDESVDKKKKIRQARNDLLLKINVLLAGLGEAERVAKIEKMPFNLKIREIENYLDDAKRNKHSLG